MSPTARKAPEPDPTPQPIPEPEAPQGIDPETLGHGPRGTEGLPNVHQAIAEVMHLVRAVGKWGQNREQNYAFRSIDHFMTALNPAMAQAGVHIVPKVLQRIVDESHTTSSNKVQRWVDLEVRFRLYGPAGDHVDVITWGEARDAADKATNKAQTAAFKYAIMEAFMVPTQDLADADQQSPEAEPQQQVRQQARSERRQSERQHPSSAGMQTVGEARQQGQERAQQPRQQAQEPARVAAPEQIMEALQNAASKRDMGVRLANLPGGLVVETAPGKFVYAKDRLREMDVVDAEGTVMTAWEAIGTFGTALPDEVHDEPISEPPATRPGAVTRRGPGEDDAEDARWLSEPTPEEPS